MLTVLDLFSGIGGFSLGLERTGGFRTVAFCEIAEYSRKVLQRHWPDVPIFEDIHDVTNESIQRRGIGRVDVITAGFPCQPFSGAGRQAGIDDERFLWPELYRVITDIGPRLVILENVPNLLRIQGGAIFAGILYDLWRSGYDVEWQVVSAAAFGAPHLRKRLWVVAYTDSKRELKLQRRKSNEWRRAGNCCSQGADVPDTNSKGLETRRSECVFQKPVSTRTDWWQVEPDVGRVVDGFPGRVDRVRALGNAVVPQVVEWIGRQILAFEGIIQ